MARVSLSVAPRVKPDPGSMTVDIREWPREVADFTRRLRVAVGRVTEQGGNFSIANARYLSGVFSPDVDRTPFVDAAMRTWENIFVHGCDRDDAFLNLIAGLSEAEEAAVPKPPSEALWQFGTYAVASLAEVFDTMNVAAAATALWPRLPGVEEALKRANVHVDSASGLNLEFWKRVFASWFAHENLHDAVGSLASHARATRAVHESLVGTSSERRQVMDEMRAAAAALGGEGPGPGAARVQSAMLDEWETARAIDRVVDYLRNQIGNAEFWQPTKRTSAGAPEAATASTFAALRREVIRFQECWGFGHRRVTREASGCDEDARNAAVRKYGGINSYPTLAKFLGFIVDVEVPIDVLRQFAIAGQDGRAYGAIAFESETTARPPAGPDVLGSLWTCFVHRTAARTLMPYFGPCLKTEAGALKPDERSALKEGVLDLTVVEAAGEYAGKSRFVLQTLDVTNATHEFCERAREASYRDARGLAASNISTGLPPWRGRGIELIDRHAAAKLIEQANREREVRSLQTVRTHARLSDVEDLTLGYRIDVALADKSRWNDASRWRSLMARDIAYRARVDNGQYKYRDIPAQYLALPGGVRRDRDDGHTRMMTGSYEAALPDPGAPIGPPPGSPTPVQPIKKQDVAHQQVFAWGGQSLATAAASTRLPNAPENAEDPRVVWPDVNADLNVDLEIDLPHAPRRGETDRRIAPLREGKSYVFGARLCLVNGCGLSFEEARSRYIDGQTRVVLGDAAGDPFEFRRREQIDAPDVLLHWNDRIVRAKRDKWPGEAVDTLVIRSGETYSTKSAERLLAPARVTFDIAEQGGIFDRVTEDTPRGAFGDGTYRALLDPATGTFPVARNGTWSFPELPDPMKTSPAPVAPSEPSRGAVFVLADTAKAPKEPFYPDPMGRRMRARFCRANQKEIRDVTGFGETSRCVDFWAPDEHPSSAAPVFLCLRKAEPHERSGLRGWFDESSAHAYANRYPSYWPVRLPSLTVALKPGESVDLEIWSAPDSAAVVQRHELFRTMLPVLRQYAARAVREGLHAEVASALSAQIERLSGADAPNVLEACLASRPLEVLQSRRYIRLVHAVDRPLQAPQFRPKTINSHRLLNFSPVVITVSAENDPTKLRESWSKFVDANAATDPLLWESAPGGTTTFFVGAIDVHRLSTGVLRCDALWREFGAESEKLDAATGTWSHQPPYQYARLFRIEDIADDDAQLGVPLDLLMDDAKGLRALSHSFVNGKARRVTVNLVATSRFTSYFPPGKETADSQVGTYEVASAPLEESDVAVWVRATARPRPPDLDRVIPVFRWSTTHDRRRTEISFRRESSLRIYLKRPWHSSGEGELLGLACWPPNLVSTNAAEQARSADEVARLDVCEIDKIGGGKVGEFARVITRWGADPIRLSGQLEDLISADRFIGFVAKASNLLLNLATDPVDPPTGAPAAVLSAQPGTASVSVIAYRPELDPREGLWACDVTIDHGAAYFPFVQLGLVRYQPNAVRGLELSSAVAYIAQIPPRREGRVTFTSEGELVLELHGVGYYRSETGGHESERHSTDVPLLNVRLLRAADEDDIPRDRDHAIRWQRVLDGAGAPVEQLRLRPLRKGPEVWWVTKVVLPNGRRDKHYGLLIEEIELMAADRMSNLTPSSCAEISFHTELEERGPLFSHIVDLRA
jgi:hypothetical protein